MNFKWTQPERVIFARMATGKTTMCKKYDNVKELSYSAYRYLDYDKSVAESNKGGFKVLNPNYHRDLLADIESGVKKDDLLLINYDEHIAKELEKLGIKFIFAYRTDWERIAELSRARNNPEEFIEKKKREYPHKMEQMKQHECTKILIPNDRYLEDVLIEFEQNNS